jgi:diguanylate cyclase (GGDEF)-like protein
MANGAQESSDTPDRQRWIVAAAALALLGTAVLRTVRYGYDLTGGLLLVCMVALSAWAAFHFRDWGRREDDLAEDLGLTPPSPEGRAPLPALPALDVAGAQDRSGAEAVKTSFCLQLDLLRTALGLTGVALLWPDASGVALRLRGLSTRRKDTLPGPYPIGSGITGILEKGRDEVTMAPVGQTFHGLPYYRRRGSTGSLCAIRIPLAGKSGGILCADRESTGPWSAEELETLRLAARRLAFDVEQGRRFLAMQRERGLYQRVSVGLRELTGGLGLESTIDAAFKAVRTVVTPDLCALVLAEGESYRVLRAEGLQAEKVRGCTFSLDEGLVGQALRYACLLPEGGGYPGASPVFGEIPLTADLRSLLILPLRMERGAPLGALAVASRKPGVFSRLHRELLELIATQVAVKTDLALAHEQINRLATTDGLTGLANHRTFQQAFKTMLQRARRQKTPLTLLLCDVDHFKGVNDTCGHPFGDVVLKEVARVLGRSVRDVDLAARYGGEEFALLLEDSDRKGGGKVAERARAAIEALELSHEGKRVPVTMSFGLAVFPESGEEIPTLIQRADEALYQAKHGGRNRVVAWSGEMGLSGENPEGMASG